MQSSKTVDTGFIGNIRRDHFGRIVVDSCGSDIDHLRHAVAKPGEDRARCRRLVEEVFEGLVGRQGRMVVSVSFEDDVTTGAVPAEVYTAETRRHRVENPGQIEEAVIAALEHIDGN